VSLDPPPSLPSSLLLHVFSTSPLLRPTFPMCERSICAQI
jgi:hypothetical protein